MTPINISDYLLDQAGFDWQTMLAGWADVLPASFTIWLVNRFADVFLIAEDGQVYFLDVAGGTFSRVAESRGQFADLADLPQNANDWLMIPLIDKCVDVGMLLRPGQCYAFKIPPLLGGGYDVGNVAPVDVVENYAFLADIWSQTKGVRDGTPVRLHIRPRPESH
jgi:hypothetical protein